MSNHTTIPAPDAAKWFGQASVDADAVAPVLALIVGVYNATLQFKPSLTQVYALILDMDDGAAIPVEIGVVRNDGGELLAHALGGTPEQAVKAARSAFDAAVEGGEVPLLEVEFDK